MVEIIPDLGKRLFIELGSDLIIEVDADGTRLPCIFLGMRVGSYLIARPGAEDFLLEHIRDKQLTLKYYQNGEVLGFTCRLVGHVDTPEPLCFFEYPRAITNFNIRRQHRYDCFVPGSLSIAHAVIGCAIVNISREGCMCRVSDFRLSDTSDPGPVALSLEDEQTGAVVEVTGLIRSWKQSEQSADLGIQFTGRNLAFDVALHAMVPRLSEHRDGGE